jgi:hypothetical protein
MLESLFGCIYATNQSNIITTVVVFHTLAGDDETPPPPDSLLLELEDRHEKAHSFQILYLLLPLLT